MPAQSWRVRAMEHKTPRGRVLSFLQALSLKPVKTATNSFYGCALCACRIYEGDQYRDGNGRRAHDACFYSVNQEYNKPERSNDNA